MENKSTSTLSDDYVLGKTENYYYESSVQEFIRRLKDEYCYCVEKIKPCRSCKFIDKLAGEKLT